MIFFATALLLLVPSARSDTCSDADECSMLQVDVSEQSSKNMRAIMQTMKQGLDNLELTPLDRAAVDVLTQSLEGQDPDWMKQLQSLVNQIRVNLLKDVAADQEFDNQLIKEFPSCTPSASSLYQPYVDAAAILDDQSDLVDAYLVCESTVQSLLADVQEQCGIYYNRLNSHSVDCHNQKPTGYDIGSFEGWKNYFNTMMKFWDDVQTSVNLYSQPCANARLPYETQVNFCKTFLRGYSGHWCHWETAMAALCSERHTCYEDLKKRVENFRSALADRLQKRKDLARGLDDVLCLLNAAINPEEDATFESATEKCRQQEYDYDGFELNQDEIPGEETCGEDRTYPAATEPVCTPVP